MAASTEYGDAGLEPVDHREPLLDGANDFHSITEAVARPVEWTTPAGWWMAWPYGRRSRVYCQPGVSLAVTLTMATARLGSAAWRIPNTLAR